MATPLTLGTLSRYRRRRPKLSAAERHFRDFHRRRGTSSETCRLTPAGLTCWLIPQTDE